LFALSEPELIIIQVSDNIEKFTGIEACDLLNRPLSCLLGTSQIDPIKQRLMLETDHLKQLDVLSLYLNIKGERQLFHGSLHRSGKLLVLELEPDKLFNHTRELSRSPYWHYQQIKILTSKLQKIRDVQQLQELVVKEVRRLTGFERVMLYKFDTDWHGHVVAESKTPEARSFLGLHFPASDIPAQARALYRRHWLRGIADIDKAPAKLIPEINPTTQMRLDLSQALLRSVSAVHVEYLRNMQVRSSLSISVLKDEQLWGLIACHHSIPKHVDYPTKTVCEVIGQILSIQMDLCENLTLYEKILRLETDKLRLDDILKLAAGLEQSRAPEAWDRLRRMVSADGVVVQFKTKQHRIGLTPNSAQIEQLITWLKTSQSGYLFFTDCLQQHYPEAADFSDVAAGLISLYVNQPELSYILWFRQEFIKAVDWAGNPEKQLESFDAMPISPRKSFAVWRSTVRHHALPWEVYELENAMSLYDLHDLSEAFWPEDAHQ
jgi:two-component system, chemotaxis family, sensor kinase Cph1